MSDLNPYGSTGSAIHQDRGAGRLVGGSILVTVAVILAVACLPLALEDPSTSCAAGHDCIALVDLRPVGWIGVGLAVGAGLLGARLIRTGTSAPHRPE
jgi:hypothetical protein